ncbi:MAG: hypothetical protein ABEJ56_03500 [Candidatus Nanohaloarchaea archaeon]
MSGLTEQISELAHERGITESEVMEKALEEGVKQLWEKNILDKYLKDEVSREKAVELLGAGKIRRAEKEVEAVEEDIEWATA